jgi:hypothetical protein
MIKQHPSLWNAFGDGQRFMLAVQALNALASVGPWKQPQAFWWQTVRGAGGCVSPQATGDRIRQGLTFCED